MSSNRLTSVIVFDQMEGETSAFQEEKLLGKDPGTRLSLVYVERRKNSVFLENSERMSHTF